MSELDSTSETPLEPDLLSEKSSELTAPNGATHASEDGKDDPIEEVKADAGVAIVDPVEAAVLPELKQSDDRGHTDVVVENAAITNEGNNMSVDADAKVDQKDINSGVIAVGDKAINGDGVAEGDKAVATDEVDVGDKALNSDEVAENDEAVNNDEVAKSDKAVTTSAEVAVGDKAVSSSEVAKGDKALINDDAAKGDISVASDGVTVDTDDTKFECANAENPVEHEAVNVMTSDVHVMEIGEVEGSGNMEVQEVENLNEVQGAKDDASAEGLVSEAKDAVDKEEGKHGEGSTDKQEDITKEDQCNLMNVEVEQKGENHAEILEMEVDNRELHKDVDEKEVQDEVDDEEMGEAKEVVESKDEEVVGAAGVVDDEKENDNEEKVKTVEATMKENEDHVEVKQDDSEILENVDETDKPKDSDVDNVEDDAKLDETPKKKRPRSARDNKPQGNGKKHEQKTSVELLNTPSAYALDRPVRERKSVERLVEVIEKEPNNAVVIEKGRGTRLKDIPNVVRKLIKKKPSELKLLHQTLFGRKGRAADYRHNLLQFSGFVWHESDEKQRAKLKERLDKHVKDEVLSMCYLLDIPVTARSSRKEDLIVKLLDFIAEPHAKSDASPHGEAGNSGKRKRTSMGSATKSAGTTPSKRAKKNDEDEVHPRKSFDEYDSDENDDAFESEENKEDDDVDEYTFESGKDTGSAKKSSKKTSSAGAVKSTGASNKSQSLEKCTTKVSTGQSKDVESPEGGEKVFSRKRKSSVTPNQVASSDRAKSSGKRSSITRVKAPAKDLPSEEDLKKTITGILKKVDFNTATFSDILTKLADHYKMDMTPRKEAVKILIQEELTRLAEEAEDEDDDGEEEAAKPKGKGKQLAV